MLAGILILSPLWGNEAGRFLPLLYLAAALIVGAVLIALISRWRRAPSRLSMTDSEQLAQFELLRKQGAISEEEYKKLRSLLGGELRKTLDLPAPAAAPISTKARTTSARFIRDDLSSRQAAAGRRI